MGGIYGIWRRIGFRVIYSCVFFFFSSRRRHTRSLCDWSSDVCSSDLDGAVDQAITAFAEDVERLKALEAEVADLDPQAAGQSVFRDPERLSEAEESAAKVREGGAPPPGPSAAFPLAAFAVEIGRAHV